MRRERERRDERESNNMREVERRDEREKKIRNIIWFILNIYLI